MKNKIWRIALSTLIAFALWLYVVTVVTPESDETFYDIPISYQNDILEERGLMIVSDTPTVTLKLKGNRSDLNELNANNITILVNLAAIQAPGLQMLDYNVSFPGNIPSNAIEVLSQSPNILQLKVENRIKKVVPVVLEFQGSVPEGYIADKDNPLLDTAAVEVVGPESSVSLIEKAVVRLDLNDQSESIIGAYDYLLCDAAGEPVDAHLVTTNVENVNLSVKIQRIKEVPLTVQIVDGGGATADTCKIELSRETIWVCGSESKLKDLNEVNLGSVNLAELKSDTNTLTFDVILPEGVTNMTGETEVTATVSFPGLAKKKLTISMEQFQSIGVPAGATVTWITEVVEVELRGPKDLIRSITEKDLTVTVDFSDEDMGSVSKIPKVTLSAGYGSIGAISISTVTATLQEETTDATAG